MAVGQGEDYDYDVEDYAIELQVCCNETALEVTWTVLSELHIRSVQILKYECYDDNLNQVLQIIIIIAISQPQS